MILTYPLFFILQKEHFILLTDFFTKVDQQNINVDQLLSES